MHIQRQQEGLYSYEYCSDRGCSLSKSGLERVSCVPLHISLDYCTRPFVMAGGLFYGGGFELVMFVDDDNTLLVATI